jgi:hypothetical protein
MTIVECPHRRYEPNRLAERRARLRQLRPRADNQHYRHLSAAAAQLFTVVEQRNRESTVWRRLSRLGLGDFSPYVESCRPRGSKARSGNWLVH